MKIKNDKIEVSVNENAEIDSIKFNDHQVMHDGKKYWGKIYPMIFPVVGFSDGFKVNGKNYKIDKHGFWKNLSWEKMYEENSISFVNTVLKNDDFPFSIDIQHNISLEKNNIEIKTIFSNIGSEVAYFHFGHHPAFKIDENAKIIMEQNSLQEIDLDGKLKKDKVLVNKISNLKFGTKYDTLVKKEWNGKITLQNENYQIKILSSDFSNIQIWKPQEANFVCLEPWEGYNDREYNAPPEVEQKLDIIKLNVGEIKSFAITISIVK